jgi:hypothetical protein
MSLAVVREFATDGIRQASKKNTGNSRAVAQGHYFQVTESRFEQAIREAA